MSHEKRKLINRRCNELHRRERHSSVYVESLGDEPSFYCYPGQQLQARVTEKKLGFFKHVLYCVQSVDANECVLRMHSGYSDDAKSVCDSVTALCT